MKIHLYQDEFILFLLIAFVMGVAFIKIIDYFNRPKAKAKDEKSELSDDRSEFEWDAGFYSDAWFKRDKDTNNDDDERTERAS